MNAIMRGIVPTFMVIGGLFLWWLFWTSVEIAIDRIIGVFS